jgi:hypothetical protein
LSIETLVGCAISEYVKIVAGDVVSTAEGTIKGEERIGVEISPIGKADTRAAEQIACAA